MKKIYQILDLSPSASPGEVAEAYARLRAFLSEERFQSGERGNTAARQLTDLEAAYQQYLTEQQYAEQARARANMTIEDVDRAIKAGQLDDAQAGLDAITDRGAEWHYYQSIVYYKREWLTECRKQLILAVGLAPGNNEYRSALERLEQLMGNGQIPPNAFRSQQPPPNSQEPKGIFGGNALCDCCTAYCIADCCCSLLQCG